MNKSDNKTLKEIALLFLSLQEMKNQNLEAI
jgi:hypothetical protein